MSFEKKTTEEKIRLRKPELKDGIEIHNLVKNSKPLLDLNSLYCYLLISDHFSETSAVAVHNLKVCGFLSAYIHPKKKDTLFVWQVAVDKKMRGVGLASSMLNDILKRDNLKEISYIETTITPSNTASIAFFRSAARKLNTQCKQKPYFTGNFFGGEDHEEEILFRIGPFNLKQ